MDLQVHNLFQVEDGDREEIFPLLQNDAFVLEHIVSRGEASEPGFWYDQGKDEWVLLVSGSATLEFADHEAVSLVAGDTLLIPAHCRHRVAATSSDARWIALHFGAE